MTNQNRSGAVQSPLLVAVVLATTFGGGVATAQPQFQYPDPIYDGGFLPADQCILNQAPALTCPEHVEVDTDESCGWVLGDANLPGVAADPEGHDTACAAVPRYGNSLWVRELNVQCQDACGDAPEHPCSTVVVPRDRLVPNIDVGAPLAALPLEAGAPHEWVDIRDVCDIAITDNCTPGHRVLTGITGIESSDPNEAILGQPGYFVSDSLLADWNRFIVSRDPANADPRVYTFTFAAVDAYGNHTEDSCRLVVGNAIDDTCDGVDDDADGQIDEDFAPQPSTCGVGTCGAQGQLVCQNGQIIDTCVPGPAAAELCGSGADEDCDGLVDEGFDVGAACTSGAGACEADGVKVCAGDGNGTVCNAQPGVPTAELCGDGIDNNCNNLTDEGFNTGDPCTAGVGECAAIGQFVCTADGTGTECNAQAGQAGVELCGTGADEDCDGQTDEDFDVGDACSVGVGTCRADGQKVCTADRTATECNAQPGAPSDEICGNGEDDNCDGSTDEGFNAGDACSAGEGACRTDGQFVCTADGSGTECSAVAGVAGDELCGNGIDDDCDGSVDEGFDAGDACSVGVGICRAEGQKVCTADRLGTECNAQAGAAGDELCGNGQDDDCDGSTDEGFDNLGDACSMGVGACEAAGTFVCTANGSGTECNAAPGAPAAETCNGIDDNCDGTVDDNPADAGAACQAGQGECLVDGNVACVNGALACNAVAGDPQAESCNGLDDDCNGAVDDNPTDAGGACSSGLGACQVGGNILCVNGALDCNAVPGDPQAEACNGVDDDCDGVVDNNPADAGGACSAGVGACQAGGNFVCVAGALACNAVAGDPQAELCNNVDDDCDGDVDNNLTDTGDVCAAGVGECQADGAIQCVNGALECDAVPNPAADELCNGRDDDCDGVVDNAPIDAGGACQAGQGECAAVGAFECVAAALVCGAQAGQPDAELCDGLDNDCDGEVDNGFDLQNDPNHCGNCGFACDVANATPACDAGTCAIAQCNAGFEDQNGDPSDGCEAAGCVPTNGGVEVCDNVDNDCDGTVDENLIRDPCSVGVGACAAPGIEVCFLGAFVCAGQPGAPAAETCNSVDDDCDGVVDNDPTDAGGACQAGVGECVADGIEQCVNGTIACDAQPGAPVAELCDSLDNDCDGAVDNGIDVATDANNCGECGNVCNLANASAICVGGGCAIGACDPGFNDDNADPTDGCEGGGCVPTNGGVEACDGIDNDCDGTADENIIRDPCLVGVGACQAPGIEVCFLGSFQCAGQPGVPAAEDTCDNGIDDDCDGAVDEGCAPDDQDADGVLDAADNCPADANPLQEDGDGDGPGDVCDNCPAVANADQADTEFEYAGFAFTNADGLVYEFEPGSTLSVPDEASGPLNGTNLEIDCGACDQATFASPATAIGGGQELCGISVEVPRQLAANLMELCARSTLTGNTYDFRMLSFGAKGNCTDSDGGASCGIAGGLTSILTATPAADGVGDACDNCTTVPNANQANADFDDFGDLCDTHPQCFAFIETLGDLPGGTVDARALGISDDGEVIVGSGHSAASGGGTEAFRWTADTGFVGLGTFADGPIFFSDARAVSSDGSIITGVSLSAASCATPETCATEGFFWTEFTGLVPLGAIGPAVQPSSVPNAISDDGLVIVGTGCGTLCTNFGPQFSDAFIYNIIGATPMSEISAGLVTRAEGVSGDGDIVVGQHLINDPDLGLTANGYLYQRSTDSLFDMLAGFADVNVYDTTSTGLVQIGEFDNGNGELEAFYFISGVALDTMGVGMAPKALTGDGSTAIGTLNEGQADSKGVFYQLGAGTQTFDDLLGGPSCGIDLAGHSVVEANDVTDNGLVTAITLRGPDGTRTAGRLLLVTSGPPDLGDQDPDGDVIATPVDNCADIANPDQADSDGDFVGDACDLDDDNDGVADLDDNCPFVPNADQLDADTDLLGDACDPDACGDGLQNGNETGVDCGGGQCGACVAGDGCVLVTDCASQICEANICTAAVCDDGVRNGDESDIDCGGATCDGCPGSFECIDGGDCLSGECTDLGGLLGCTDPQDADLDGIFDNLDNCPALANADQANSDGDEHGDACDNCTAVDNSDQSDLDADGVGDVCDNCVIVANGNQNDADFDGAGDLCDPRPGCGLLVNFFDVAGGGILTQAKGISADGLVVVGRSVSAASSPNFEAMRWTLQDGAVGLGHLDSPAVFSSEALAASGDGSIIVGGSASAASCPDGVNCFAEAMLWTEGTGMIGLGGIGAFPVSTTANSISDFGNVIVGTGCGDVCDVTGGGLNDAFYIEAAGSGVPEQLGFGILSAGFVTPNGAHIGGQQLTADFSALEGYRYELATGAILTYGGGIEDRVITAMTDDNSVVVGQYEDVDTTLRGFFVLDGAQLFDMGLEVAPKDLSNDGFTVVGTEFPNTPQSKAVLWDPFVGLRRVDDVVKNTCGVDLEGVSFLEGDGISGNGGFIVGTARNQFGSLVGYRMLILEVPVDLGADDTDSDGIANPIDNCPATPNLDQTDTDGDGDGDACEDDDDADTVLDVDDNCPVVPNTDQADADGDLTGDACDPDACADGIRNGNESGLDCGGGFCDSCPDGQICLASSDCQSGVCTALQCAAPACDDGVMNGDEPSVDCGGANCGGCADGERCGADADCASGLCDDLNGLFQCLPSGP